MTGLSGLESPEQLTEPRPWKVRFALLPADGSLRDLNIDPHEMMGDSNFALSSQEIQDYLAQPLDQPVDTPTGRVMTTIVLRTNGNGRLGLIAIKVEAAESSVQAFNIAKTAFDFIHLRIALATEIPLKYAFCHLQDETEESRFAIRYVEPFPVVEILFNEQFLPPVLQRMASAYIEALNSNSYFYAFLCRYKLVDALTGNIQGIFRRLGQQYSVEMLNLNGQFSADEVGDFLPELVGAGYRETVTRLKDLRVRVAHMLTSVGFQALNAHSQDQAERFAQALHIAARNLLLSAIDNYERLRSKGVSQEELKV